MTERSLDCNKCGHVWFVNVYSWELTCPKCSHRMKRVGGEEYCTCSHQQKNHTRPETGGCYLCGCMEFSNVKKYVPNKDDAELFRWKTDKMKSDK